MELKWVEDFLTLVETGNFSAAAARRHVTQPAFSRRIRSLEQWLGVPLVDRSTKPVQFTKFALDNEGAFRNLVAWAYELRSQLQAQSAGEFTFTVAVQHSLSAALLPAIAGELRENGLESAFRLRTANQTDCITMFVRGEADILLCFEHQRGFQAVTNLSVRRKHLNREQLILVSATEASGRPRFHAVEGERLPLISYPQHSFFGQVLWQEHLPELMRRFRVETVCVSAFAHSIRQMVLNGLGAAWLPGLLVNRDVVEGRLAPLPSYPFTCTLDVVMYASPNPRKKGVDFAWDVICRTIGASPEAW